MTRTTLFAALAIMILGLVLFSVRKQRYTELVTGGDMVGVVTALGEFEGGRSLLPSDLGIVMRPVLFVETRHVTQEDVLRIVGITTREALRPGQVITWDDLNIDQLQELDAPSLSIQPGQRAVSVNTHARTFGDLLIPGDHADVFFTAPPAEEHPNMTVLLAQNVAVLADAVVRVERGTNSYEWQRSVTLATDPMQASLLQHAARTGTLDFAIRHPEDERITTEEMVATAEDLVEPAEREERSRRRRPQPPTRSITRIE